MTYSGLTLETSVVDDAMSSHCIPAYPESNSSTVYNAAYYALRQASNDALVGGAINLEEV
jgi:hypothetical protein